MGGVQSSCQRILNIVRPNDPVLNVRITGLEGSGKKSIINFIKHGKTTFSEEIEETEEESETNWVLYDKYKLMLWTAEVDISKVFENEGEEDDESHSNAIIFVVDGTDESNFMRAKAEIKRELERSRLSPELLVMINKSDLPTCANVDELYNILELGNITDRHVHIEKTSALTGSGIKEGLDWLCTRFEIKNGEYVNRKDTM